MTGLAILSRAVVAALCATAIVAAPTSDAKAASPSVVLDQATFTGVTDGITSKYLGIPFAKPPTGDLRFRQPVAIDPYTGTHVATAFGPSCPQQAVLLALPPDLATDTIDFITDVVLDVIEPQSEDCTS